MTRIKKEFNTDLVGFILTLESGRKAHAQFEIETSPLSADCGDIFLARYTEHDDELTDDESYEIDNWVDANKWQYSELVALRYGIIVANKSVHEIMVEATEHYKSLLRVLNHMSKEDDFETTVDQLLGEADDEIKAKHGVKMDSELHVELNELRIRFENLAMDHTDLVICCCCDKKYDNDDTPAVIAQGGDYICLDCWDDDEHGDELEN